MSVAFENIHLHEEIHNTQKEIIEKLGEVVETRSNETAFHVHRVAELSEILAKAYGLSDEDANMLKMASPMHDIGKIGISDNILLKPEKLTEKEYEVMKTHAVIGADILKSSKRVLLQTAAIVAEEHHERYDGTGYPKGLSGEDIHIYGRITAIADIYDALVHKRCYKDAWKIEDAKQYLKDESGKIFDPKLVNLFFENYKKIEAMSPNYKS